MFHHLKVILLIMSLSLLILACGQKGALYLPEQVDLEPVADESKQDDTSKQAKQTNNINPE